jgi:hypothetical protein
MPRIKSWSTRIPLILQHLWSDPQRLYTRQDVEALFITGRSQAADLMQIAGSTVRNGLPAVVTRENLRYYVEHGPEAAAYLTEQDRKRKLAKRLQQTTEELRQKAIPIPGAEPADEWTKWEDLANVAVEPGMMRIAFYGYVELLNTLWLVSRAMANEPEALRGMCAADAPADSPRTAA